MAPPQPHDGAGASQHGAGASQHGVGAGSQHGAGAGASQQGAGAGSQQVGAPLHLAALLAFSFASKPTPLQSASFFA